MDETGLLLLFSSFPCALLLIMLTDLAEQRQHAAAAAVLAQDPPRPQVARASLPPEGWIWDVARFFKGPG